MKNKCRDPNGCTTAADPQAVRTLIAKKEEKEKKERNPGKHVENIVSEMDGEGKLQQLIDDIDDKKSKLEVIFEG